MLYPSFYILCISEFKFIYSVLNVYFICLLYVYMYTLYCIYYTGLYPTESDDYEALRDAISKLKLNVRHVYTVVLLLLQCDGYLMDI